TLILCGQIGETSLKSHTLNVSKFPILISPANKRGHTAATVRIGSIYLAIVKFEKTMFILVLLLHPCALVYSQGIFCVKWKKVRRHSVAKRCLAVSTPSLCELIPHNELILGFFTDNCRSCVVRDK